MPRTERATCAQRGGTFTGVSLKDAASDIREGSEQRLQEMFTYLSCENYENEDKDVDEVLVGGHIAYIRVPLGRLKDIFNLLICKASLTRQTNVENRSFEYPENPKLQDRK